MSDLIERKKVENITWQEPYYHDPLNVLTEVREKVLALPTVEAEPVRHGNWEPFDEDEYSCSLCGNIFVTMDGGHPLSNGFKFCPFCGAKMDERKEE